MKTKIILSQQMVSVIIAAGQEEAWKNNWSVSIAVVDNDGHLLVSGRMGNCTPTAAYISQEKARTATLGRCETKGYEEMVNNGCTAFMTVPLLTSLESGVLVVVGGQITGIMGASGLIEVQDMQAAKAAVVVLAKWAETRRETISQTTTQDRLRINANSKHLVDEEVLSGTRSDAATLWCNFDEIVHDLVPENHQLLAERDRIQVTLDERYCSSPGPVKDKVACKFFLRELGYLVPQPERATVKATGIDSEVTSQAGPQSVVPAMNACYVLNATNAHQGSLYDALYDSDITSQERMMASGYDPQHDEQVIAWARCFFNESPPLEDDSYQDAVAFEVVDK